MAGRYSPIYSGVWNHEALEGTSFECKAFFVFLCSNERVRPSGIYRVTDAQLAVDTGLPSRSIRHYLDDLVRRCRIIRDGAWLFVRGYLDRQPKQERLLKSVLNDITECGSLLVLRAFGEKYPIYRRWSDDRLLTINRPLQPNVSSEQSRVDTEQSSRGSGDHRPESPPAGGFERFWAAYPKRVGKGAARTAWIRAQAETVVDTILTAVDQQRAYLERDGGRFIPLPATWLNQRRWEDDPPQDFLHA
jgi:hypothetical protein